MSHADDAPITLPISKPRVSGRHRKTRDSDTDVLDVGAQYVREIRRHKWIGAAMAMFLGAGGAGGVAYTTSDRSKANELKVTNLEKSGIALEPRVKKTESDIQSIKSSMGAIEKSQKSISGGIEELKQVNIKRLEKELAAKEREIVAKEREILRLRNRSR